MEKKRLRLSSRAAAVALATATLGAAAVALSSPASASAAFGPSYIGSNSGGANLRTCANTGCASIAYMANGTAVTMTCWVDSQVVSPPNSDYTSARWFYLSTPWGSGYTHSSLVENQTSVGHCPP